MHAQQSLCASLPELLQQPVAVYGLVFAPADDVDESFLLGPVQDRSAFEAVLSGQRTGQNDLRRHHELSAGCRSNPGAVQSQEMTDSEKWGGSLRLEAARLVSADIVDKDCNPKEGGLIHLGLMRLRCTLYEASFSTPPPRTSMWTGCDVTTSDVLQVVPVYQGGHGSCKGEGMYTGC